MKYVQTHFLKENLSALQVFLCALISHSVCTFTRAQLRGNTDPESFRLFFWTTLLTSRSIQVGLWQFEDYGTGGSSAGSCSKFSVVFTENAAMVELPTVSDSGSTAVQRQVHPETGHSEWSLNQIIRCSA